MPRIIKPAKGSFTTADITIDSSGRVIAASTGQAGGAGATIPELVKQGPATGTYTANSNATVAVAYMCGGGGGGGASMPGASSPGQRDGGNGGKGAFGVFTKDLTHPFSQPFSVGAKGQGVNFDSPGTNQGGATTIANIGTANGGQAGGGAGPSTPGNPGSAGTAPGSTNNVSNCDPNVMGATTEATSAGGDVEISAFGGVGAKSPTQGRGTGTDGAPGYLIVFEDR